MAYCNFAVCFQFKKSRRNSHFALLKSTNLKNLETEVALLLDAKQLYGTQVSMAERININVIVDVLELCREDGL